MPRDHPLFHVVSRLIHDAWSGLLDREEEWSCGRWSVDTLPMAIRPASVATTAPATASPPPRKRQIALTEMLKKHAGRNPATHQTRTEQELAVSRFVQFLGRDPLVHEIEIEQADEFYELLRRLPRHAPKGKDLRDLAEAADKAEAPRLAPASIGKALQLLSAVMETAVMLEFADRNPFRAVVPRSAPVAKTPRVPFAPADMRAIFSAPLFVSCAGPDDWSVAGDHRVADERFWLPLIGATSGARLEEIGQLHTLDIKQEAGVWFMDITTLAEGEGGDEKRLKTKASRRRVPLHPVVLAAGFLGYAQQRRDDRRNPHLFPRLEGNSFGKKTAKFSDWFNQEFLERIGVTSPSKVSQRLLSNFLTLVARAA